ncbi:MAG: hypothetical protein SXA11_06900 [Cyanobacteriota bacterium]|nr:hypothetical protein [Cyanobacteriota bacterium]
MEGKQLTFDSLLQPKASTKKTKATKAQTVEAPFLMVALSLMQRWETPKDTQQLTLAILDNRRKH